MIHFRGTRKNMADFVESPSFIKDLNEMIKSTDAKVTAKDAKLPTYNYKVFREKSLTDFLKLHYSEELATKYLLWWFKKISFNQKTYFWDLISTCEINGKKGILLVHSKSHTKDLVAFGMGRLHNVYHPDEANETDISIDQALDEANKGINKQASGVEISTSKCYPLANRIANAWWLANNGIPTVLLFQGVLNGQGAYYDFKTTFKSDKDWQDQFNDKAKLIGVNNIMDKWIDCEAASFITISRSMEGK